MLTAAMPTPTILAVIVADWIMIVTGLVGALTQTRYVFQLRKPSFIQILMHLFRYKWGYYAFGNAAFFYVVWALVFEGRRHANALGGSISRTYNMCGVLTIFVWFLYPIAWGVSEGGNVIHPDSEAVFYGILDLIAKPVFGFLLLWGHRNIDPAALGLHIREPGMSHEQVRKEKHVGDHGHLGAQNGTHNGTQTGVDNTVRNGEQAA